MTHPTDSPGVRKEANRPPKPYPDFPLYAHPLGYWSKKINGKIHHFGRWGKSVNGVVVRNAEDGNWSEALKLYQAQREDLYAGRKPRVRRTKDGTIDDGPLSVKQLGDRFLTAKLRRKTAGELSARMFEEYRETCQLLADHVGKDRPVDDLTADDFEQLRAAMAERWGPVRLGNTITRIKSVFKYAVDNGLVLTLPRYGSEFKKPGKRVMRTHRAESGQKMFTAAQLQAMLTKADPQLKAMILLGANCGLGNHDVGSLPFSALDLDGGWLTFPRPKTGIARRCPLWPETVAALKAAIAERPKPRSEADADVVLLNPTGRRWVRETEKSRTDALSVIFADLLKRLEIHRAGLNFYALRHTFRTIADAARDSVAIDLIMGHADPSMGAHYREHIDDERLQAVTEHVRTWLFGKAPDSSGNKADEPADNATQRPTGQREEELPQPFAGPALRLYVG